ncbi:MAG TPA: hypothetical protein VEY07_06320 [Thermoplasmata archaeon]|nr:hypothetical protein [Thermoplasmata archaeon]
MAPGPEPSATDPIRATLIAILKQLNQAESVHEGQAAEQALELTELERRLGDFWAVDQGTVKVSLALGLLLRNGLVTAQGNGDFSWQRQRTAKQLYQITAEGKKFLVETIRTNDRIG